MDEPSNHLDISSKEIVEDFLNEFPGTVLMVSHDRYLLDAVCTRTLELENQQVTSYLGNYTYYKQKKAELARIAREKEEEQLAKQQAKKTKADPQKPKINKAKLKKEIEELEEQIPALYDRWGELTQTLEEN